MSMKTLASSLLIGISMLVANCYAQPAFVEETNTPIALHYAGILKEYVSFILPKLGSNENLLDTSKEYFNKMGYRVVTISIEKTTPPKTSASWKIPHSKLAVLPRMICYLSQSGATVQLHDQGDDYILLHNHTDNVSINPGLFISVGITHQWE